MTMATKGERTRGRIARASAELMNQRGYLSAPVAEIIEATGIQKGGLYRHFESKEALIYAAFDFAVAQVRERFMSALQGKISAPERLLAIVQAYRSSSIDVPLAGGCPIMNSAIEADHAHAGLRARAREAMTAWRKMIARIVGDGVKTGELRAGIDANATAVVVIASLEGAVMLTQLHRDRRALDATIDHLVTYIERDLRAPSKPTGGRRALSKRRRA